MNRLGTPLAFGLYEYQFTHHRFFGRALNIVHHLYPPHLVGRLEVFINALSLGKLYCQRGQHFVCLFVDLGEVGVEPSFTEQGRLPSTTVLLEIVEVHLSVFTDWLLFGKLHVGNEAAVFLAVCTSELFVNGLLHYIFHPFIYFMPLRIFIVGGIFFVIFHNSSLSFLTIQALRI